MKRTILKLASLVTITMLVIGCSSESEGEGEEENQNETDQTEEVVEEAFVPQNSTLELLGSTFINALKENKYEYLETFLPNVDDFKEIVNLYEGSDEEKKDILVDSEENSTKIQENTAEAFEKILEKGTADGITWEEVSFKEAAYNLNPENNVEYADVTISLNYGTLEYKIFISECIKTSRGWLIFDKPKWQG
ncbi:hypothetical protein JYT74_03805 [Crocinitomix catalasitica]|nr:hypothetical protein [Crocinitomix catalasitica]